MTESKLIRELADLEKYVALNSSDYKHKKDFIEVKNLLALGLEK